MKPAILTTDTILLDVDATSKSDLIHRLCAQLFLARHTEDPRALYDDIIAREEIVSTFAGNQMAIPHTITQHIKEPVLSFARLKNPDFTWNSSDEEVLFVFLLCAPKTEDLKELRRSQSQVFSSVARLLSQPELVQLLASTEQPEQILESLHQAFADTREPHDNQVRTS